MFTSALKSFSSNITANYTISATPSSTAGAWKVFDGKKKSTGKVVSIFIFERKALEPQGGRLNSRSDAASRRKIQDEVVERLKKEAGSLARLRHPNILELAEAVEDTRSGGLMFATEPVTDTLAGLLQKQDDQDKSTNSQSRFGHHKGEEVHGEQREAVFDELEIQKGLLQISKGLEFLHESAGLVHGNLTPESIYINAKSDWKLSGMGFSGPPDASNKNTSSPPIALSELLYHDPRLPRNVQLNLDFTSPDFVMDSNISSSADMFSLGLVVVALYNSPHTSPLHTSGNITTYKKIFSLSSSIPASSNNFLCGKPLPRQLLVDVLPRLITRKPAQRINAREFQQSAFFDNILVSAIRFLDSFPAKTPNEKAQFMRGLPTILEQFPRSVLDRKVLPAILGEIKDKELLALVLIDVFSIIRILPSGQRAFADKVLPQLRETFHSTAANVHPGDRDVSKEAGLVVVLDNIGLIIEQCSGKSFKDDILPIIQLGLESSTHSLVDKSLTTLSTILPILDFSTIKNDLFPIIAAVFTKTSSLSIKVRSLEALGILCGANPSDHPIPTNISPRTSSTTLDKYTVQEKVVPLLKGIKTKEPAVMMAALAVFNEVGKIADTEFLAIDILPVLWSFSLGPLLNLQQFAEYMSLIKVVSGKIEVEQTRKLRELASTSTNGLANTRGNDLMSMPSNDSHFGTSSGAGFGEDDFERLVLGRDNPSTNATTSIFNTNNSFRPLQPQRSHTATSMTTSPTWPTSPPGPSAMASILHSQQGPVSRAITPDHSLSSIGVLKPTSPASPSSNDIMAQSHWNGMQSIQSLHANTMTVNPWGSPPMANAWASPPATTTGASSAWGTLPGVKGSMAGNIGNLGMKPAIATQQGSGFGIAPPPTGPGRGQKTGLDKYESLI